MRIFRAILITVHLERTYRFNETFVKQHEMPTGIRVDKNWKLWFY